MYQLPVSSRCLGAASSSAFLYPIPPLEHTSNREAVKHDSSLSSLCPPLSTSPYNSSILSTPHLFITISVYSHLPQKHHNLLPSSDGETRQLRRFQLIHSSHQMQIHKTLEIPRRFHTENRSCHDIIASYEDKSSTHVNMRTFHPFPGTNRSRTLR